MDNVKITFLGTGNAIPTKLRNHTAILLSYKSENILVDCGEGTQRQFKIAGISPSKLTKILITHWHGDHILGLPGLMQTLSMSEYCGKLEIYGPKGLSEFLSFLNPLMKVYNPIKYTVHEVTGKFFENEDFILQAEHMKHGIPTNAYSFTIKDKLRLDKKKLKNFHLPSSPILKDLQQGKSIKFNGKTIHAKQVSFLEKGRKVTFILDTLYNQAAVDLAKNSNLLICESTFSSELEKEAHEKNHMTAKEAATIAKKAKVSSLILTHISQRYEFNPKEIENDAKKVFPHVSIPKDLDSITI